MFSGIYRNAFILTKGEVKGYKWREYHFWQEILRRALHDRLSVHTKCGPKGQYGSFSWKMEKTNEGFIIYRSKYYNPGHYPVSDYPLFYSFQKSIRKADTQKFLFRLKA